MEFQLNFTKPADISPFLPQDSIFFVTKENFFTQNLTLSSNIRPQINSSNETTNTEQIGQLVESTMNTFTSMNFVMSIWL